MKKGISHSGQLRHAALVDSPERGALIKKAMPYISQLLQASSSLVAQHRSTTSECARLMISSSFHAISTIDTSSMSTSGSPHAVRGFVVVQK